MPTLEVLAGALEHTHIISNVVEGAERETSLSRSDSDFSTGHTL